jgi:serine/threonine protein kinase
VEAIDELKGLGISENVVLVTRHGWLISGLYFIDMELCECDLEQYIRDSKNCPSYTADLNPRLFGVAEQVEISNTWDIMEQISSGIQFIHACDLVHRDLKPSNGIRILRF